MGKTLGERLEHAWDAFRGKEVEIRVPLGGEIHYGTNPLRFRSHHQNQKRIIAPILTQIAVDAAGVEMRHVRIGEDQEYLEDINSRFNECLMMSPNLDQSPTQFRQDAIMTMLEEGVVAIVPVETTINPQVSGGYDITQLRVGTISSWMPQHVRVDVYNERIGRREEVILPKTQVAIVENPLYAVLNEPNSTMQRLLNKLSALDVTDDRLASGKLDIILQLPYTIKREARRAEAQQRIGALEQQLSGSQYGVGYIDGTERITQLNRPSENNLLEQVKGLESRLYAQLGLTEEIFFGTADEAAMLNYHNRTVFPIVRAIQEEMRRKFLTKTARTQGQSVRYFRNPFSLVPVNQIAEIADKFTRNEIMSPNEFRPIVGLRPVDDEAANELRNRNMPKVIDEVKEEPKKETEPSKTNDDSMRAVLARIERENTDEEA